MRLIVAIGILMAATSTSAPSGGTLPDRGDASGSYRGVDIPHHDADPARDGDR